MSNPITKFDTTEITILQKIALKFKASKGWEIKKITKEFNKECKSKYHKFKSKSAKDIKMKLDCIFNIKKHYWSQQINQKMLDLVAEGKLWKQISQAHQFYQHGLLPNQIKVKFQCGMRNKFKCLYRHAYQEEPPNISDIILKFLLQEKAILSFYEEKIINFQQKQSLINNIKYFRVCPQDEDLSFRSQMAKQKLLSFLNPGTSPCVLVDSIIKLNQHKKIKLNPGKEHSNQFLEQNQFTRSFSTVVDLQQPIQYDYCEAVSQIFFEDHASFQQESHPQNLKLNFPQDFPLEGKEEIYNCIMDGSIIGSNDYLF